MYETIYAEEFDTFDRFDMDSLMHYALDYQVQIILFFVWSQ